jgi:hypothetical protein
VIAGEPSGVGSAPSNLDRAACQDDLIAQFVNTGQAVIELLLATHVDDGTGHCKVCRGGPQAGRDVFPCRLRVLAEGAAKLAAGGPT